MLPASLAHAWLLWRRHRVGFFLIAGYLVCTRILVAASAPYSGPGSMNFTLVMATVFLGCFTPVFFIGVFSYGFEGADVLGRESCFPARLFRLPVRNATLVVWPLVYGAAAAILSWLVVVLFILRPWLQTLGLETPLWWPGVFFAAALAWLQALLWLPFGLRSLRVVLIVPLLLGLSLSAGFGAKFAIPEGYLVAFFGCLAGAGWTTCYAGVRQARHGDVPAWDALLWPVRQLVRRLPWRSRRRAPFASAAQAQFWFEWRLTGKVLPIMVFLAMPSSLWVLFFGKNDLLSTEQAVLGALGILILFAGIMGAQGSGNNPGVKGGPGLGSFSATLPISTAGMVAAMLKTAARSTLWTWPLVAIIFPLALVASGTLKDVVGWSRQHADARAAVAIVAITFVWTWKRQVDRLYFGLTGRGWVATIIAFVCIPGSLGICYVAGQILYHPGTYGPALMVLPWGLGALVGCRLLLAAWALRRVLHLNLVEPRTLARWMICWLLLAASLFGLLAWAVPADRVPVYYLAYAILFVMPMVRLAASPLALAWNRHR